jgi:hypothetical protein
MRLARPNQARYPSDATRSQLPDSFSATWAEVISLIGLLISGLAQAQDFSGYDLSWSKVAGGGGTSTNAGWEISGTIGQADAGVLAAGEWVVEGGFWFGALVTAGAPPPVVTLLGANPLTNECHAAFVDPGATVTATCPGGVSVLTNSTVNPNAVGVYSLSYVARDACRNSATNARVVYVVDTTPPAITCPADLFIVTTDPVGTNVSFTVTAADSCDGNPTAVSMPASGSFFPAGTNPVSCYAYDGSLNTNTCAFVVAVDRAPVAQTSLSFILLQDQALNLSWGQLLAVVSDADSDALSVNSADPSSTNGGMVTLASTNLTYQPAASYTGADLFRYMVSDGRGGVATNTVLVSVLPPAAVAPSVVYGPLVAAGQFVVRFAGVPGLTYTIEATEDLHSPIWTKMVNMTAPLLD